MSSQTESAAAPAGSRRPPPGGTAGLSLAIWAVACLAAAEIAQLAMAPDTAAILSACWAPTGVLVGGLLLSERRRRLPLALIGGLMMLLSLALVHGRPAGPSLGVSVLATVDAVATVWLVRRFLADVFSLERFADAWALVACAAVVPLATGALANVLPGLAGSVTEIPLWRSWWLAEVLGIVVAAPLTIIAVRASRTAGAAAWRSWRTAELVLALALGLVSVEIVFSALLGPTLRVPALVLPFVVWPVLRFGPAGASAAVGTIGFLVLWHGSRGEGPVLFVDPGDMLLRAQTGVVVAGATLLLFASVVSERRRVAQERAALVVELQQALAEIRTLRGFLPICAWCHKVRDDAGFWQDIERYLDAHTDATVSHSICPACVEREHRTIAAHRSVAGASPVN